MFKHFNVKLEVLIDGREYRPVYKILAKNEKEAKEEAALDLTFEGIRNEQTVAINKIEII
jgi:hypothetical protein